MTGRGIIVHEWLERTGGAENVVTRLAGLFPDADIVALWDDSQERFPRERVTETWLARTPLRRSKALSLPLMPTVWRHLGKRDVDWLLCSSHVFAHHARFSGAARDAAKLVFAHTPARYIWEPGIDQRGAHPLTRTAGATFRPLDRRRAQEPVAIAAVSEYVRQRIERAWQRESTVIHPPVAVTSFADHVVSLSAAEEHIASALPDTFLLGASRLIPYKRMDQVIAAGTATGLPVVIAGSGPDLPRLQHLADASGTQVHFVPRPSHDLLVELYRRALAYVFPAIEDFGIMPVEAMATGTPVIGTSLGGVSETVIHNESGVLVDSFDSRTELRAAVDTATHLRPDTIASRAWTFDQERFDQDIRDWMATVIPHHRQSG